MTGSEVREYNAAVFGSSSAGNSREMGAPFGPEGFDAFERAHLVHGISEAFASDPAVLGGVELGVRVTVRVDEADDPLRVLAGLGEAFREAAKKAYAVEVRVSEAEILSQGRFEEREGGGTRSGEAVDEEI